MLTRNTGRRGQPPEDKDNLCGRSYLVPTKMRDITFWRSRQRTRRTTMWVQSRLHRREEGRLVIIGYREDGDEPVSLPEISGNSPDFVFSAAKAKKTANK